MKKPFFSVVMPLYNKQSSVERAVSSVLSQNFARFELIVVDDGSTDCSADVVADFDDTRLELIKQPNKGPSVARNRGFNAAAADYVCFLDADDEWEPVFLDTMSSLIGVAPRASLYCVNHKVVDESGHIFYRMSHFAEAWMGYVDDFYKVYATTEIINSSSVCIRKKSLHEIGGFPEHARIGEDIYTWLRLADLYRVAYANVDCATIYRDAENRSGVSVRQDIPYHIKTVLEGMAKEFKKVNQSTVIRFVAKNTVLQAAGSVLNGDRSIAFKMARMLWKGSRSHSVQVFCVALMPRAFLKLIKKLRNAS